MWKSAMLYGSDRSKRGVYSGEGAPRGPAGGDLGAVPAARLGGEPHRLLELLLELDFISSLPP